MTTRTGSVRRAHRTNVKRRSYVALVVANDSNTSNTRETLVIPSKGTRIRLLRTRVIQEQADGRHLWELYFGDAPNMITGPNKGIDILAVPDSGATATRVFRKSQGPRGKQNEVLSGRWRGFAPSNPHKIIIEYSEES